MLTLSRLGKINGRDPDVGQSLKQLQDAINSIAQQSSIDPTGVLTAPPQISSLTVTAANGIFFATITDNPNNLKLGINYFLEYSPLDSFPQNQTIIVHLVASRSWSGNLGNQTLFFRAYSQYPNSPVSNFVSAGPVTGGGSAPPAFPTTSGSGTSSDSGAGLGAQEQDTGRTTTQ